VITRPTTDPSPLLREGAVYWADNGRRICARCAGASALYTGRDLSGQPVERVTIDDVNAWPEDLGHCLRSLLPIPPRSQPPSELAVTPLVIHPHRSLVDQSGLHGYS
jgi:hypothetical protein